jgi:hypothetical protein
VCRGVSATPEGQNVLLFPCAAEMAGLDAPIECRERLGGLLKSYCRRTLESLDHIGGKSATSLHAART